MGSSADRQLILLIFMLSGCAGLVYEVVWCRQLVLVFGNTTQAISAILTGFFGGMAIGSVIGGRLSDRVRSPLRMYALLELLVVLTVLLTQVAFGGLPELYRGAYQTLSQDPFLLALVRFVLSLIALAPATVLMGATLPTLSRYLVRHHAALGHEFGELYLVNTTGAIYGVLLSGVFLIELIGMRTTLLVGTILSGTSGVMALLVNRRAERSGGVLPPDEPGHGGKAPRPEVRSSGKAPGGQAATRPTLHQLTSRPRLALGLAFVSGLTSLGYQTIWNRILSSGTGANSYIFTSILVIFLAGIAIGAYLFSHHLHRTRHPVAMLGIAELALAALVIATLGVETDVLGLGVFDLGFYGSLVLVVAPATLIMGIVFPMSSMLVSESDERVGTSAGLLLGSNTLGSICGTFVVPFVLMPVLTSPRTVVCLALVNALTGLVLLWKAGIVRARRRRAGRVAAVAISLVAVAILVVPNSLAADPAINRANHGAGTVLGHGEDEVASVQAIAWPDHSRGLLVGGVGVTTLSVTTRLMAHLPLMARPQSTSMCNIALGMGSTFRSGLIDGLKVDAVELVPTVPGMLVHFFPDGDKVLANPNGRIYVTDGRNFVQLTRSTYDLIVVDPPPPTDSSGTGVLFSQEFYQASRARLNSGGIMMQWVLGDQSVDEMRSHVRTFSSVFAHVTLFFSPVEQIPGIMMLGSDDPIELTPDGIDSVLARPGVLDDLNGAPDSMASVQTAASWRSFILDSVWISDSRARAFGAGGSMITDDRPYTEYTLLRHIFGPRSPDAVKAELLKAMPRSGG